MHPKVGQGCNSKSGSFKKRFSVFRRLKLSFSQKMTSSYFQASLSKNCLILVYWLSPIILYGNFHHFLNERSSDSEQRSFLNILLYKHALRELTRTKLSPVGQGHCTRLISISTQTLLVCFIILYNKHTRLCLPSNYDIRQR